MVAPIVVNISNPRSLQIERLAYCLWRHRGMPLGSPEEDWLLAEALLTRRQQRLELSMCERPLFSFGIERRTR